MRIKDICLTRRPQIYKRKGNGKNDRKKEKRSNKLKYIRRLYLPFGLRHGIWWNPPYRITHPV